MTTHHRSFSVLSALPLFAGALLAMTSNAASQEMQIPFQKFVLENGLEVVILEDHSDPVVAVYVNYHVGSGREELGRSGFAHLFEHLMFQGSAHVADDGHFKLVSGAGGTLNGTTNRDRTNYFETLPSNQLETALWLEADRMGFLLGAITQEKLDNQREVVKNERRQNYENVPYAQAGKDVMAALYPHGHSYSWLTIGSHEDLTAASLEDVRGFFRRWYGPNNATLAIGGDVDVEQALAPAKKWFGGIPRGPDVARPVARPAGLEQTMRLVAEDKVQLPELSITWPSVPKNSEDEAALLMLSAVLSANKSAILDRALTIDEVLATRVSASQDSGEVAGEFDITVRAAPGVTLDALEQKVHDLLAKAAHDGIDAAALKRQQTRYEANFVNRLETVSARTSALAEANTFTGDPATATGLLKQVLAVTPAQVQSVLQRYLIGRPAVIMSVVPLGKLDMAASGRSSAQLAVEQGVDRSTQPQPSAPTAFRPPVLWHDMLANGVMVTGTLYTELPLVTMQLAVPAGSMRETLDRVGLASLTAELMNEGTTTLSTTELADRLDELGANLNVSANDDEIVISLRVLQRNLPAAVGLLQDVLLRPRFSQQDFERIRTQRLAALATRGDSIRTIVGNAWGRLQYGKDSPAGWPSAGTTESVSRLTLDDVKAFYKANVVPGGSRLIVVGDLQPAAVHDLFAPLVASWKGAAPAPIAASVRPTVDGTRIYLVDKPGSPQSEIRIGHASVAATDPDYYPLSVLNYILGGAFSSRINMNLREDKGYTYGARTGFAGGLRPGSFTASSPVRTDVTKESVIELMKELNAIKEGVTEEETVFAREALAQSMNRQYESIGSLAGLLDNVSQLGYPDDYPAQRLALLGTISKADLDALATKAIHPDRAMILVVGDSEKVKEGLDSLGYGPVIELDIDGNPIAQS